MESESNLPEPSSLPHPPEKSQKYSRLDKLSQVETGHLKNLKSIVDWINYLKLKLVVYILSLPAASHYIYDAI